MKAGRPLYGEGTMRRKWAAPAAGSGRRRLVDWPAPISWRAALRCWTRGDPGDRPNGEVRRARPQGDDHPRGDGRPRDGPITVAPVVPAGVLAPRVPPSAAIVGI